jgi:hypothetical protein
MTSKKIPDILHRRDEILQEMAEIDRMQRGTLSEQFFKQKKGGHEVILGPYYVLQHWVSGKHSQRVPAEDVPPVRSAIEGRKRFEKLAEEFVEITERLTQETTQNQDAKKNARKSTRRNTKKPKPS